ncbi:uncharacterized protein LOC112504048 [Cynara cardunculus var. scolymus]|uniref:uncharacterized protein LOC112504048 n=1 Tax=Cynara cardunculus var. scolymus TaxID=59895 RepID=UPI000D630BD7|nr:uncharacterized protein LOC112504048 [Cynara cardunculus var. scolymus]
MAPGSKLHADPSNKAVDQKTDQGMSGSLMNLTYCRPDIIFRTHLCAISDKSKRVHLSAVKHIFCYLKGSANLGLWYPKGIGFELTAYSNTNYAGCMLDRKFTSGHVQFLRDKLVSWASKKQNYVSTSTAEVEYVAAASCCSQVI